MAVANRFTLEDVELNKKGKVSPRQLAMLGWRSWSPMWTSTSAMLGWFLTLWIAHALMPTSLEMWLMKKVWFWKLIGITILGITLTTVGSFLASFLRFGRRTFMLFLDTLQGDVQSVQGRVNPSWEEVDATGLGKARGDKISIFKYCVKDMEFDVTSAGYNLLVSKYDDYRPAVRLFYAPRSKMLLSVVPEDASPQEVKLDDNKWVYRGLDGSNAPVKRSILPPVAKQKDPDLTPLRKALGASVKPAALPPPPPPAATRPVNVRRPAPPEQAAPPAAAPEPQPATARQAPPLPPRAAPAGPPAPQRQAAPGPRPAGPPPPPQRQTPPSPPQRPAAPPAGAAAPPARTVPPAAPPGQPRRW